MKAGILILHLIIKLAPLLRKIDISNLFLPFKVALVFALTFRDAIGVSAHASLLTDALTITTAAVLTGLLLWPKPRVAALGARQK